LVLFNGVNSAANDTGIVCVNIFLK